MKNNELNILWTNADPLTSEHMVMLYAINAQKRGWFEQVNLIIWGGTAALTVNNPKINELVLEAMEVGIKVSGCIRCAIDLGVDKQLTEMGIELLSMGAPLTELIKNKENLITI